MESGAIHQDNSAYSNNKTIPPEFVALDNDLKFIKVRKNSKIPLEADWPGINNYSANDPNLQSWISQGGNWGYFLRDDTDLCILDADRPDELQDLVSFLGPTLTVKTGRDGTGYHILFRCDGLHTRKLFLYSPDKKGNDGNPLNLGDIRPGATVKKYQCVGPGSIHPDTGRPYTIVDSSSPVTIKKENLFKVIGKYRAKNQTGKSSRRQVAMGGRDTYLTQQAGSLFNRGYRDNDLFRELTKINQEDCNPPIEVQELERIWKSAITNFKPAPTTRTLAIDERPYQAFTLTDLGNAERFKRQYGNQVIFCPTLKKWYIWNGQYWEPDETNKRERLAIDVVRRIYKEAAAEDDEVQRKKLASWAQISESHQKRTAMIQTVSSILSTHHEDLDNQPDLFNLQNGTYNLKTHEFREHRQEDLLTKISKCNYDPKATCTIWEKHLNLIFSEDKDLIEGFQDLCGYSLLSGNPEEIFIICWGSGRNGKGKTLDTLAHIHGGYCRDAQFSSFTASDKSFGGGGGANNDIARLTGARLVRASESMAGARLDEATVKKITGGDVMTARFLRQEFFEFMPQFILFLQTNHKPIIRNWDAAIEARIWLVPFDIFIEKEKRDPKILQKMIAEDSGIFNWMISGLKRYQDNGRLTQPEAVKTATDEYKAEQDIIGEFIRDKCILGPEYYEYRNKLYDQYQSYCQANGVMPYGQKRFASSLVNTHRVKSGDKIEGKRTWKGIKLADGTDQNRNTDHTLMLESKPDQSAQSAQVSKETYDNGLNFKTGTSGTLDTCFHITPTKHTQAGYTELSAQSAQVPKNGSDHDLDPTYTTLQEWITIHKVPKLPPPDQYRDYVKNPSAYHCICVGCNNTPLKTKSGNYPLCQQHLREYTQFYEKENQEAES